MAAKQSAEEQQSSAVEAPDLESAVPKHGFFVRLYTGTGAFEVIGKRKLWYAISGLIVAVCLASMLLRGFTFGIDFEGGTKRGGEAKVEDVPSRRLPHEVDDRGAGEEDGR